MLRKSPSCNRNKRINGAAEKLRVYRADFTNWPSKKPEKNPGKPWKILENSPQNPQSTTVWSIQSGSPLPDPMQRFNIMKPDQIL